MYLHVYIRLHVTCVALDQSTEECLALGCVAWYSDKREHSLGGSRMYLQMKPSAYTNIKNNAKITLIYLFLPRTMATKFLWPSKCAAAVMPLLPNLHTIPGRGRRKYNT